MQERLAQPPRNGLRIQILLTDMRGARGRQHPPLRVDDEQLGQVRELGTLLFQQVDIHMSQPFAQARGQVRQMVPVGAHPVLQDAHPGLRNAFEHLLDGGIHTTVQPAGPAHRQLAGASQPGQPVTFTRGKLHLEALKLGHRAVLVDRKDILANCN